jgi:uncharacterized protein (TIGR00369 family)
VPRATVATGTGGYKRRRRGRESVTTDAFPPTVERLFAEYIERRHGYLSWLGTRVESVEYGRAVLSVPFDEKLVNDEPRAGGERRGGAPQVHGGVAATLVDTAGAVAQRTLFDDPLAGGIATVNLNVNYLRPAAGDLEATAEVVRAGGTIGVSAVTVEGPAPDDGERHPVATGQVSYRLFRDAGARGGDAAADGSNDDRAKGDASGAGVAGEGPSGDAAGDGASGDGVAGEGPSDDA